MTAPTTPAGEKKPLPTGFRGPVLPLNTPSGDMRQFMLADGAEPAVRPLPVALSAQGEMWGAHQGSRVVGLVTRAWVQDGHLWAEGPLDLEDEFGAEYARKLGDGFAGWVSADLSDISLEEIPLRSDKSEWAPDELAAAYAAFESGTGDEPDVAGQLLRVHEWKLMGVTGVSSPAFETSRIEPVYGDEFTAVRASAALTAAAQQHSGAMIALVPSVEDCARLAIDGYEPADVLHTTLVFLGDAANWSPEQRDALEQALGGVGLAPMTGHVFGRAEFDNGNPCAVYLADVPGITSLQSAVLGALEDSGLYSLVPPLRETFIPHVTVAYSDKNASGTNDPSDSTISESAVAASGTKRGLPGEQTDPVKGSSVGSSARTKATDVGLSSDTRSGSQQDSQRGRGRPSQMWKSEVHKDGSPGIDGSRGAFGVARGTADTTDVLETRGRVPQAGYAGLGDLPGMPSGGVSAMERKKSRQDRARSDDGGTEGAEAGDGRAAQEGELGEVRSESARTASASGGGEGGAGGLPALTYTGPIRYDRIRVAFADTDVRDIPLEPVTAGLVASSVVYDTADFTMPEPDELTALTVTDDGRVYGHLAQADSCHIGFADVCVSPPTSATGYAYFHQGEISTTEGPLPVGKLTLGTGHAGMRQAARAAAEHYDNTGTAVAVVRCTDGLWGPWLSGRILPGIDDDRIEELRRSGVSGDWRSIQRGSNNLELVAVLAVNVPGFPVPRTRALAASGMRSLIAAGVPPTRKRHVEPEPSITASAIASHVRAELRASAIRESRRETATQRVRAARLAAATRKVQRLTDTPGDDRKAKPLERYWTEGKGLTRWAEKPHPFTSLVDALTKEIPPGEMTPEQIKGLAAKYYHKVFRKWPGKRNDNNGKG